MRPLVEFRYYKTDEDVEPIKSVDVSSYVAVPDDRTVLATHLELQSPRLYGNR